MGFGSSLKKAVGSTIGGQLASSGTGQQFLGSGAAGVGGLALGRIFAPGDTNSAGEALTPEQITTANLFRNLSPEQQKDLLINNPNIETASGSQIYDPLTNTVRLNEGDFQRDQRLRQEGLAEQLSSSLDGNLPSSNEEIQNATFERGKALLDPEFASRRRALEQQLADQGIPQGSEQHTEALNRFEQSQNRAFTDLSQASIQTAEMQRQQRFNEISSLLGNAQIGGQSFNQFQPQFSGLDIFGAEQAGINRQFQQSMLSDQLRQSNRNAQYQALGSLGAAGISAFSDITLKENIDKVGEENGFNIYEFNYIEQPETRYKGVMAQEVQKVMPEAVVEKDGYLAVNYDKIGIKMEVVNGGK